MELATVLADIGTRRLRHTRGRGRTLLHPLTVAYNHELDGQEASLHRPFWTRRRVRATRPLQDGRAQGGPGVDDALLFHVNIRH